MKGRLFKHVCGMQPVRVIYGDGEVLHLPPLTTVEEVLQSYPHHFVCQPGLSSDSGSRGNQMMSLEDELQSGCIYFLLPVPRLFPGSMSTSCQCRCFANNASTAAVEGVLENKSYMSPLRIYSSPQRFGGFGPQLRSPKHRSLREMLRSSKSKVLPESNLYSADRDESMASSPRPAWRKCPWRPRLGCISEEDGLEMALEELRYHGFMLRRESISTAVKLPPKLPSPPPRPAPILKSAKVTARSEVGWSSVAAGVPTLVATY
ncbi:uncharacterized protein [Physcomitrium patens]|uniref:Uncharacterized protein n=1 Tax=Physcomitrium patens TaxID=3218 RepID=A0A2K1KSZ2_PHYPA|nr:uncharacterized protein LOC112280419 [Physcomitrium patens]PNR56898.1 hypothetical protein PHYPA_003890 [Physcomitrium patens]|eukprot:XP_024371660.1 uncharacterized protein LOC112280419 [Physcomitrella patens]